MYTIITPFVEKECVSNICFVGSKQNLVEVKDDSISGGEVCIRVDYLAVAELFADHHLIKQFDRTLCIATLCESELT